MSTSGLGDEHVIIDVETFVMDQPHNECVIARVREYEKTIKRAEVLKILCDRFRCAKMIKCEIEKEFDRHRTVVNVEKSRYAYHVRVEQSRHERNIKLLNEKRDLWNETTDSIIEECSMGYRIDSLESIIQ